MLDPQGRRHLMEALRPPEGYELDQAVGTTFSLDLLALLTAPLAFTIFDWEDEEGRPGADPLALLETMRRYADRISVFCQAGQISVPSVPRERQRLFGYLEGSIFEVSARRPRGSFHPKVWALRFTAPESKVLYRFLCLSRNLTFDRSWDTMLVLEGELTERRNAFAVNNPLGDFFAAIPHLAVHDLPERVRESVDLIQHELRRVRFELPEGFDSLYFHPLGIGGVPRWPFKGRVDRMLVISPFVSDGMMGRLSEEANARVLVSRLESLERSTPERLEAFERVCVLNAMAEPEESGEEEQLGDGMAPLSGLHAKLYVADAGWNARVWTGSANATNAAFERNVEFLVELNGKKSYCGIERLLSQSAVETNFAELLQDYTPREDGECPDAEMERLTELADGVRRRLATASFTAEVNTLPGEIESFEIRLRFRERSSFVSPSEEVSVRCWPITLPASAVSLEANAEGSIVFGPLSFDALTSFFAYELVASSGDKKIINRFVLNVPLEGAPSDRRERIMRSLLDSQDKVLRLILFLLAEGGHDSHEALLATRRMLSDGSGNGGVRTDFPLFEALVRALERDPVRLDQIARLLDELRKSPEGQRLVPQGLEAIWEPILSVRGRLEA